MLENGNSNIAVPVIVDSGTNNSTNRVSQNESNAIAKKRSLDYYLWIMTSVVTHVEVLLEKVAGTFWGETSKEQSLLVISTV